ncbi:hypothetical protein [Anabaena azotica]|uniref:Uncharacterized protein n=1 Tax=Anabaena azotica FACHB-119 TaxID=947527 RepID=A0ABR8D9Q4_9NOST|nr:hypothetical protein [Anabaena azotica]MBD2503943.1 hypothetical protein [Anabaena azotica FACHB-119]
MKYLRSEIAKLESYREQRDFEISGKSAVSSFSIFQEEFLYSSNERHIKRLELLEKWHNSLIVKIIGVESFGDISEIIGTASFSDSKMTEEPTPEVCSGCVNYHGLTYEGGIKLICAIHPYGCKDEYCPDYLRD